MVATVQRSKFDFLHLCEDVAEDLALTRAGERLAQGHQSATKADRICDHLHLRSPSITKQTTPPVAHSHLQATTWGMHGKPPYDSGAVFSFPRPSTGSTRVFRYFQASRNALSNLLLFMVCQREDHLLLVYLSKHLVCELCAFPFLLSLSFLSPALAFGGGVGVVAMW
jgi:hypothetical protein